MTLSIADVGIDQVVLDAGPASYGWESTGEASPNAPGTYRLEVSADGEHWTVVRTADGTGQMMPAPPVLPAC